jgi:two-component system, chemotaxis family, chemotaxis protein CheY
MTAKILTVDDSISIRKMIEFALKSKGYTVVAAGDGQEGLEVLERGERFDLVVLDINMPRMDGLTLLKNIRAKPEWGRLPVLMLTTEGQDGDRDTAIGLGASDYMVKPFKPTELLERVGKLLERK